MKSKIQQYTNIKQFVNWWVNTAFPSDHHSDCVLIRSSLSSTISNGLLLVAFAFDFYHL